MLLIAVAAVPAQAQTPQAAAAEAEEVAASTGDEADDDDLLEPSNTGYVDDAVVGSKFRLRYDSATGADKADRAEFFYGKCDCFTALFGQDAASPGPVKDLDFTELELTYEHAFNRRFSLFVEVPFRSIDLTVAGPPGGPNTLLDTSGLGDVRAGAKYALVAEPDRYVTLQLRGYFASGDAGSSLGTDHASIEPGILYFNLLSDRVTLSSEFRWWHPLTGSSDPLSGGFAGQPRNETGALIPNPGADGVLGTADDGPTNPPVEGLRDDGFAGDILRFGFGVSHEGRGEKITVSPVAELVGWYVVDGYSFSAAGLEEADNDTIVNLKLGARISGKRPGSFYIGYGVALSHEDWYDDILRFEYRLPLAAPKRYRAKMAAARAAEERAQADRVAAAQAAETAAAELAARRAEAIEAEAAARAAEARRTKAEAAARKADAMRAEAEAAAAQARAAAEARAAAAAAQPNRRVAAGATPCLNLRPEPSLSAERLFCLQPGAAVTLLEPGDGWSRIRTRHGMEGWSVSRGLEPMR